MRDETILWADRLTHPIPDEVDPLVILDQRRAILERCSTDLTYRGQILDICAKDVAFFADYFLWTFDPRVPAPRMPSMPFILYGFQQVAIRRIAKAVIKGQDLVITKSRDMGASWMVLAVFLHQWLFSEMRSFMLASRKEEYVDSVGNPDSLFWRIDEMIRNLPLWMLPPIKQGADRKLLRLVNSLNGCIITGESTTGNIGRAGRHTAILLDEFAAMPDGNLVMQATRDVTPSRIFLSTMSSAGDAFDTIAKSESFPILTLHWSVHPEKRRGLYLKDHKLRSPWYDDQCKRALSEAEIAIELDIETAGGGAFFSGDLVTQLLKDSRAPYAVGELKIPKAHPTEIRAEQFENDPQGAWKVWTSISHNGSPMRDADYIVGCDIATGTGASNSTISVGDAKRCEKIMSFASPRMMPHEFAHLAVALCRWLQGATNNVLLVWEANGPGRIFGKTVMEGCRYFNVWWRQNDEKTDAKPTTMAGFYSTQDMKMALLGEFRAALATGKYLVRDQEEINELRDYAFTTTGGVAHMRATSGNDPSGARDNHGDRVISDALVWYVMAKRGASRKSTDQLQDDGEFWKEYRRLMAEQESAASRRFVFSSRRFGTR